MPDRPNILLVHCHDLGRHLGCYGADVETPNLDALAADGHRFEELYATAPQCSPSRASIITGKYPQSHGVLGLAHMNWELEPDENTLPRYLSELGYATHLFGFQHEVSWDRPGDLGYDTTWTESQRALELAEEVGRFVHDREAAEPFFASVGFVEPHREFRRDYVPDEAFDRYDPEEVQVPDYLPDRPGVREDVAALNSLITATVDEAVGRIRDDLAAAGIADETLLVFTTDHGIALPRAKGTGYDPGIETALLLHWPGSIEGGVVHDDLLSNVDLLPTLLELVDGEPDPGIDGRSFAPLLEGRDGAFDGRDAIYFGMTWHDGYNPFRGVRTERYKYIRNFSLLPLVFLPSDIFGTPAGRAVQEEYYTTLRPVEELYDLREDPAEQHNLASDRLIHQEPEEATDPDPAYVETLERLRRIVRSHLAELDDPLLEGPVAYPDPTEERSTSERVASGQEYQGNH